MVTTPKEDVIEYINNLMDSIPSVCDKNFDLNNDNYIDQTDLTIAQGMTDSSAFEVMKEYELCKARKYMYLTVIAAVAVVIIVVLVARQMLK